MMPCTVTLLAELQSAVRRNQHEDHFPRKGMAGVTMLRITCGPEQHASAKSTPAAKHSRAVGG
eukprot:337122-Pelagomonas_calceolata.AAC.6